MKKLNVIYPFMSNYKIDLGLPFLTAIELLTINENEPWELLTEWSLRYGKFKPETGVTFLIFAVIVLFLVLLGYGSKKMI